MSWLKEELETLYWKGKRKEYQIYVLSGTKEVERLLLEIKPCIKR